MVKPTNNAALAIPDVVCEVVDWYGGPDRAVDWRNTDRFKLEEKLRRANADRVVYLHLPLGALDPWYVGSTMCAVKTLRPYMTGNRGKSLGRKRSKWWRKANALGAYRARIVAIAECSDLRYLLEASLILLHERTVINHLTYLNIPSPSPEDIAWALRHPLLARWTRQWAAACETSQRRLSKLTDGHCSARKPSYVCCGDYH